MALSISDDFFSILCYGRLLKIKLNEAKDTIILWSFVVIMAKILFVVGASSKEEYAELVS